MYHIVINPASRSGKGRRLWAVAEPYFRESGENYQVHFSSADQGIRTLVHEITSTGESVDLVIMGGDGTLNEALNGIADFSRVRIGLIPVGSGNDFARDAGISKNIAEAAKSVLRSDNHRTFDLGQVIWYGTERPDNSDFTTQHPQITDLSFSGASVSSEYSEDQSEKNPDSIPSTRHPASKNENRSAETQSVFPEIRLPEDSSTIQTDPPAVYKRFFIISSGFGFDAQICYEADHSRWKKILNRIHLGKLIYIFTAIRLILTANRTRLSVEITQADKLQPETLEFDDCLFAVCMNHRFEGGGFQFAPEADPSDGILDLCIASGISRPRFFKLFPKAYSGGHVGAEGIHILRGTEIKIRSDIPLHIHTDGEVPDTADNVKVILHPRCLHFLN